MPLSGNANNARLYQSSIKLNLARKTILLSNIESGQDKKILNTYDLESSPIKARVRIISPKAN